MTIGQICNRNTVVVRQNDSIVETARLMRQMHVGSVVVVDDTDGQVRPIGILTDRDLVVEILALGVDPATLKAGDVMNYPLLTAHVNDGIWESLQRMRSQGIRRMPVVDAGGELAGILTADDLLELLGDELVDLAKLTTREIEREERRRGETLT